MKILHDPSFDAACGAGIAYWFFTRQGGASTGIYDSLNCSPGSSDDQTLVAENRRRVAGQLGGENLPVISLWQCHSADCLYVEEQVASGEARPHADALVTDKPGLILGVLTADCGPVLFHGLKRDGAPVIGAAHAGWGGALGGVLESTIVKMREAGAEAETVTACLGPCLMQPSYEVQNDFMRPFVIKHEEAEKFFMAAHKPGHQMFDLAGYIAMRLALAGVRRVSLMGIDTYANEADFFSFRRATHRSESDYGRQISAIVINS